MGLTVDLDRVATAVRSLAARLRAVPSHGGEPVEGAARLPFVLGVEALADELLAVVDVGEFGTAEVNLEGRVLEWCRTRCPFPRKSTPGLAPRCAGCPLQSVPLALYAGAADAGKAE